LPVLHRRINKNGKQKNPATITVSNSTNGINETLDISFTVKQQIAPTVNDFSIIGNEAVKWDGTAKSVIVTPKTTQQSIIIVYYNNGSTTTAPSAVGTYTVPFDVKSQDGSYTAAQGLQAGTLTINGLTQITSATVLTAWLGLQSGGATADAPVNVLPIVLDLGDMTQAGSGWRDLIEAIETAGKFVNIKLSGCTMNGTEINPDYSMDSGGKGKIVSLTLPAVATSIVDGNISQQGFSYFTALKIIVGTNIVSIGSYAFYSTTNSNVTSVTFPAATSIDEYAFGYCSNLSSINFPVATSIGNGYKKFNAALG